MKDERILLFRLVDPILRVSEKLIERELPDPKLENLLIAIAKSLRFKKQKKFQILWKKRWLKLYPKIPQIVEYLDLDTAFNCTIQHKDHEKFLQVFWIACESAKRTGLAPEAIYIDLLSEEDLETSVLPTLRKWLKQNQSQTAPLLSALSKKFDKNYFLTESIMSAAYEGKQQSLELLEILILKDKEAAEAFIDFLAKKQTIQAQRKVMFELLYLILQKDIPDLKSLSPVIFNKFLEINDEWFIRCQVLLYEKGFTNEWPASWASKSFDLASKALVGKLLKRREGMDEQLCLVLTKPTMRMTCLNCWIASLASRNDIEERVELFRANSKVSENLSQFFNPLSEIRNVQTALAYLEFTELLSELSIPSNSIDTFIVQTVLSISKILRIATKNKSQRTQLLSKISNFQKKNKRNVIEQCFPIFYYSAASNWEKYDFRLASLILAYSEEMKKDDRISILVSLELAHSKRNKNLWLSLIKRNKIRLPESTDFLSKDLILSSSFHSLKSLLRNWTWKNMKLVTEKHSSSYQSYSVQKVVFELSLFYDSLLSSFDNSNHTKQERVLDLIVEISSQWQTLMGAKLDLTIASLRKFFTEVKDKAMVAATLYRKLGIAFMDLQSAFDSEDTTITKSRITDCNLELWMNLPINDSGIICSKLSSTRVLTAETAKFIIPIISAFLESNCGKPSQMVALHKAAMLLATQMKLGAAVDPEVVLKSLETILSAPQSSAALVPTSIDMIKALPKMSNFNSSSHLVGIARLLAHDSSRLRKSIICEVLPKIKMNESLINKEAVAYLYCCRFDESSNVIASEAMILLEQWKVVQGEIEEAILISLLSKPSEIFREMAAKAVAGKIVRNPDLSKTLIAELKRFNSEAFNESSSSFQGFTLNQEELKKLKQLTDGREPIQLHNGVFGVLKAMKESVMDCSWDSNSKLILDFFFTDEEALLLLGESKAKVPIDPKLAQHLESLFVRIVESHDREAFSYLKEKLAKGNVHSVLEKASAVALGSSTLSNEESRTMLTKVLLNSKTARELKWNAAKGLASATRTFLTTGEDPEIMQTSMDEFQTTAIESLDVEVKIGAALGFAAVCKSHPQLAFKNFDTVSQLLKLATEGASATTRHGAFLCLDGIVSCVPRLHWEGFATEMVSTLLQGLSDIAVPVRNIAEGLRKKFMKALSASALAHVVPKLVTFITESSSAWRTKVGSIELLSSIAAASHTHVSQCLPEIVPVLCQSAHDQHKEVKEATKIAVGILAESIVNPEMRAKAQELQTCVTDLGEPELEHFLSMFVKSTFEHFLEGSSLAFLAPILNRGLKARKSQIKIMSCQVVSVLGLLCKDPEKELLQHYELLLPNLRACLIDPLPDIRHVSCSCLGAISQQMGKDVAVSTVPWVIEGLRVSTSSVERSGYANALAEVFYALGTEALGEHLAVILEVAGSSAQKPAIREGFLGLFIFIPLIFKEKFQDFVPQTLPVLLDGLSADSDVIRDICFRAACIFVNEYGGTHTALLLQPLEKALFHKSIEVRLRAAQLLGDLTNKILKTVEDSQDEQSIMQLEILSLERRAYILSALYLARSDEEPEVRQTATQVWKSVVNNTPRTVKELLPILTRRLVDMLGSNNEVKIGVATRCLEELALKHGEKVIPQFMQVFIDSLKSSENNVKEISADFRRGVFLGLSSVLKSAKIQQLKSHLHKLIPLFKDSLVATNSMSNRKEIAQVISKIESSFGDKTYSTQILTLLMKQLEKEEVTKSIPAVTDAIGCLVGINPPVLLNIALEKWASDQKLTSLSADDKIHFLGIVVSSSSSYIPFCFEPCIQQLSSFVERKEDLVDFELLTSELKSIIQAYPLDHFSYLVESVVQLSSTAKANFDGSAAGWRKIFKKEDSWLSEDGSIKQSEDLKKAGNFDTGNFTLRYFTAILATHSIERAIEAKSVDYEWLEPLEKSMITQILFELDHDKVIEKSKDKTPLLLHPKLEMKAQLALLVSNVIQTSPLGEKVPVLPSLTKLPLLLALTQLLHTAVMNSNSNSQTQTLAAASLFQLIVSSGEEALGAGAIKICGPLLRILTTQLNEEVRLSLINSLLMVLRRQPARMKLMIPQMQSVLLKSLMLGPQEVADQAIAGFKAITEIADERRIETLLRDLARSLPAPAPATAIQEVLSALGPKRQSLLPADLLTTISNIGI